MNFFGFNNLNMFGGCNPFAGYNPFMLRGCGCNSFANPFSFGMNPFSFGMNPFQFGMSTMPSFNNFSMPTFSNFGAISNYPSIFSNYTTMPMYSSYTMPQFTMPTFNFGNLLSTPFINFASWKPIESTTKTTDVSDTDNLPIKDTGKLDKHFLRKVKKVAKKLNCDYKDLLALINSESGFDPKAKCGSYVGLIQFGDAAVEELRTKCGYKNLTKEQIPNMSRLQQLELTEKLLMYIKKWKFSPNAKLSAGDLYAMILAPGRSNREVLYSKGESGYNPTNAKMDYNKDGKITKSEMSRRIREKSVNESIFA